MDYTSKTKSELLEIADERGIGVSDSDTKATIIEMLVGWDNTHTDEEPADDDLDLDEEAAEELPRGAQVLDFTHDEAISLVRSLRLRDPKNPDAGGSDSRWFDLSGRDKAVVQYALKRGWLYTEERPQKHGRYMLTDKGIRGQED